MDGSMFDIDHSATSASGTQILMITKIVIKNIIPDPQRIVETLYSRRMPVGLYTAITVGGLESRTDSKPILARTGDIEWDDKTILPADLSSHVCIDIYAPFELAAALGRGELLQRFQATVGDMLERSAQSPSIVFSFISEQNNPIIRYSSLTLETEFLHEDDSQTLQSSGITKSHSTIDEVDAYDLPQMTDAGHDALLRYYRSQQEKYFLDMTEQFETVLKLCPVDHPCRSTATFNLATAKFINSRADGRAVELDNAILLYREALGLRPMESPDRTNTLFHLAITLLSRSGTQRIVSDVQEAEDIISVILENTLADSLHHKMARLVIENYALSDHRDQPDHLLRKLEGVLQRCLEGDIGHLDELVTCYNNARFVHLDQLLYPRLIGNLGVALNTRFNRDGNEQDIDDAVSRLQESVSLSPERPMTLSNLSGVLSLRFQRRGDPKDLDEAISHSRNALEYQPDGDAILLQLVNVLGLRFEHQENDQDLDEAILHGFQILPTPFHLSRHIAFGVKHAARLRVRYASRGNRTDLENCIAILRFAAKLMPANHSSQPDALAVLAMALKMRFENFSDKKNLDTAIVCCREALKLMTVDHALHSDTLCLLASLLDDRFEHDSSVQDLTEAMSLYRKDLSFHPEKETKLLCKIAGAQYRRYLHTGDKQDLDDAILQLRMCMAQPSTDDDVNKNVRFTLAAALVRLHDYWDPILQTIDEAILLYRQSMELFSTDDTNYAGCMNNLAAALNSRYRQQRCKETLEEVILLYRKILASFQVAGPRRAKTLSNLGNALESLKNENFRDEIISLHKEALELQPDGDPYRPVVLCHLAQAHLHRYYSRQEKQDLDDADQYAQRSLALYHTDAVERPSTLFYLAQIACEYFEHGQKHAIENGDNASNYKEYLDIAMNYFKDAVALRSSGPIWRLRASGLWINQAEKYNHDSALEAYTCCFQVLDTHLAANASIPSRHDFVQHLPHMIDAASCALRRGDIYRALELMEQGRTLVWTQISRYRTSIDDLLQLGEHPRELAIRFQKLSSLLDNPREADGVIYKEEKASHYERIVHDWNTVVKDIRELDGFDRFLIPPLFSDLREAACDGPVIVFVASQYSCHAVVVLHRQPPLHIPLLTDCRQLAGLAERFQHIVNRTRDNVEGLLREVLQQLWDTVIAPVVDELQTFAKKHSRIWLCPTSVLTLLPLHAAGEYLRPQGRFLSQLYISSYTPSLSALIKARSHRKQQTTKRFTAIGQAQPAGYDLPLLMVEQELKLVESLVPKDTIEFSKFTSEVSTRETSLHALKQSEWIHLACHGLQRFDEPYNSSFLMLDKPLTLFDISRIDLENHEFAFLSACETAVGDTRAPDEVVHLAAGLQFAGVKSVIATMWEVEDATVSSLVQSFYKNMFADGVADCTNAAKSLHKALRSSAAKKMSLAQRIVFIHIGL